jgi:nuclear pore complex protein Nup88
MPQYYLNPQSFSLYAGLSLFLRFDFLWCSDYSKKHIQEIYEDVNAFGLKSSNPNVVTNSHLAIAWLEATFPDLLHQSTETSLLMSKAHSYAPVDDSLTLQVCLYFDFMLHCSEALC